MIIKKDMLIAIYENADKDVKNKMIIHLMDRASIKLEVYNYTMKKVLITSSYDEAFERAFNPPDKEPTGHFSSNTRLNFYKATPSLVSRTSKDLFIDLIEFINISTNVLYKEMINKKILIY